MIELYFRLVTEGRRTITQVPERFRVEVQILIESSEVI